MKQYVIGIDFGTLSGRCVLLDTVSGKEIAESVLSYPHGVMDETLPSGKRLPPFFALQHPADYLQVLGTTVRDVLQTSGVTADEVAGLGIDFTACTVLPIDQSGTPLCMTERFADEPHAYVKLWKHHAAQPMADRINDLAEERGEKWLPLYGGKISSEWAFPKILETLERAPAVYEATDRFMEAGNWLSLMLTGEETHSAVFAGYKWLWNAEDGYPSNDFLTSLHPALDGIVGTKISETVLGIRQTAGVLSALGAELTGLSEGTPLALPMIDAHAAMPALGIAGAGELMMIIGTSTCHILNTSAYIPANGVCGCVKDGVIPGLYTYEAGQSAVGDIFDWYVSGHIPASYTEEATERGIGIHKLLREKASLLKPGESGLLALDWLGGNRSTLMDADLSGLLLGMTLQTKPEEIYRAWLEATAFGTRAIIEVFTENGIDVERIVAAGGIAQKDELMMQIYADVIGKEVHIAGSTQAGARGSAIYAATAAGLYPTLSDAVAALALSDSRTYIPVAENVEKYQALYAEYQKLYRYFGKENLVMKRIKRKG